MYRILLSALITMTSCARNHEIHFREATHAAKIPSDWDGKSDWMQSSWGIHDLDAADDSINTELSLALAIRQAFDFPDSHYFDFIVSLPTKVLRVEVCLVKLSKPELCQSISKELYLERDTGERRFFSNDSSSSFKVQNGDIYRFVGFDESGKELGERSVIFTFKTAGKGESL